ncbi:MAG: UDP-3-O-(3-hydroxymyristoyl)glucosamine N-acyltransferase [Armatimonadota bacterium]|nr:UDP-3-O-(3-hydroxymyristoyl)glucosamine N-acyltransferase [Armatimonadota bacterium]MDR7470250.1 UDP-3-O-(3-hydroxymyristoyl)glucosamine N-acyltransferase [Armatimonadota bacterium]MDR7473407.1 UDP-3-O-(3-hydroxymyristoyl)glucosamine N-acyltransferase [Armatimonadota bacterium]
MRLGDLATHLGGTLAGDPAVEISGVGEPEAASPGTIVYAADADALRAAEASAAAAVLLPAELPPGRKPAIRAANARLAFARLLALFSPAPAYPPGVHPTAVLGTDVVLGDGVHVGPHVVLGDRARVGARSALLAGTVVESDARVGEDCILGPQVTVRAGCVLGHRVILHPGVVVGSDGFGYAQGESGPVKIPHLGRVVIEDDVEIGANTAVDRGTLGETRIGARTKIDNLVQVAHNVRIGRGVLIAGQVGLAGSVTVEDGAVLAGQVGVRDHTRIGAGATVLAQAGVTKDIPARQVVSGFPAWPHRQELRVQAYLRRLPELFAGFEALQRRLAELATRRARSRSKR